jgi:hypothetical protein
VLLLWCLVCGRTDADSCVDRRDSVWIGLPQQHQRRRRHCGRVACWPFALCEFASERAPHCPGYLELCHRGTLLLPSARTGIMCCVSVSELPP